MDVLTDYSRFYHGFLVATFITKGDGTASVNDQPWTPTYEHPLLHPASPPDDANPFERRGYALGLFINPVFPPSVGDFDMVYTIRNLPPGSITEGSLFRARDEKSQRRMVLFARRMFGFEKRYAAFEVGVIDETGRVALCMCDVGGTDVTESMEREIKAGTATVPMPFWKAVIRCEFRALTFVEGMTMKELEKLRREIIWGVRKLPVS